MKGREYDIALTASVDFEDEACHVTPSALTNIPVGKAAEKAASINNLSSVT
jgi:hypothetical protein